MSRRVHRTSLIDRVDAVAARLTDDGQPLAWTLRRYGRDKLRFDALAGITVAALIVPLSIGYAQVAGLPPEAGLYASLVPLLAYAIFGSSRRLIIGPDAATAAIVGATIAPLAVAADERLQLAAALALLVAVVFVAMRLASVGFLADLLSRPILVGYLTGVGIEVALGQIPRILGGSPIGDAIGVIGTTGLVGTDPAVLLDAIGLAIAQSGVNVPSVVLGLGVVVVLLLGDRFLPGLPVALVALVLALVATVALELDAKGVAVLGPVPSGLPPVGLPLISIEQALALLPGALGIAILSFADTTLTGRSFSARHGEEIDPNRELVALAAADLGASLSSGYPVSASPSRTAAGEAAGSRTQLTGVVAAAGVAVVLIFLTGPMAMLPIPALGAVILVSVARLINVDGIVRIWRLDRTEGAIAVAAVLGVILYGTLAGVGVAVILAAVNVFRRAASPRIDELGRLPDGATFASLSRNPQAERVQGLIVVRYAGPLFFATVSALIRGVRGLIADRTDPRVVVLDASAIVDLDLTAADALRQLDQELGVVGIEFIIARPTGALRDLMRSLGLGDLVGDESEVRRTIVAAIGSRHAARPAESVEDSLSNPESARAPLMPAEPRGGVAMRRTNRHRAGLLLLGAVAIGVVLAVAVIRGEPEPSTAPTTGSAAVPNLVGLPLDRARTAVEAAGLVLADPTYVQSRGAAEGTVVLQTPAAGTLVASGSPVAPVVSTTRALVAIPDVVGLTEAEAVVTLADAELRIGETVPETSTDVPAGSVIGTVPAAGREVAAGSAVALVVSTGEPGASATPRPTPSALPSTAPSRSPEPSESPEPSPSVEQSP
ncbi:MAG TPA: SulP family inorganic anion transporter [Candidatus Limnocylindrales bacterium]|nr:SulP family inorganic anion transporter [Candidatus Limnocylindrales bacterium]